MRTHSNITHENRRISSYISLHSSARSIASHSFEYNSFHDSHDSMPWRQRNTCPDGAIAQYAKALTLDMIYVDNIDLLVEDSVGICDNEDVCNGWSDHVPIFASYSI